jgi:hypothetical protein
VDPDAYSVYRPGGKPRLIPSAVLFLDILGRADERDAEEAQAYLSLTHGAFVRARDWGDSERGANSFKIASWFSDNLVMGMPADLLGPGYAIDLLAMYAALHQLVLSEAGLFARGAITFGPFYADAEFVNGPALNEAHDLEAHVASGPRVILSPSAMAALDGHVQKDELDAYIAVGDDGLPFVDYLRYLSYVTPEIDDEAPVLERLGGHIRDNLVRFADNARVWPKYDWLASYYDARVAKHLRVRPDQEPAQLRLLDPMM